MTRSQLAEGKGECARTMARNNAAQSTYTEFKFSRKRVVPSPEASRSHGQALHDYYDTPPCQEPACCDEEEHRAFRIFRTQEAAFEDQRLRKETGK